MTIGSGVFFFVVVFLGGELFVLQFFSVLFSVFSHLCVVISTGSYS